MGDQVVGTAWEIAGRVDSYEGEPAGAASGAVLEYAFGINYYVNGHGNKLSLDASIIEGQDPGSALLWDAYAGYGNAAQGEEPFGILLRFQWQLAL